MAYDLFLLLSDKPTIDNFDLRSLWLLLLKNDREPRDNAWAFGHTIVEFWTQNLTVEQLEARYEFYIKSKSEC